MAVKKTVAKEAANTVVTVTFNGEEYVLEQDRDKIPFEALEAFEDGKPVAFLRAMLGAKDYARLKKSVKTVADFNTFMDAVLESAGIDPKDSEF